MQEPSPTVDPGGLDGGTSLAPKWISASVSAILLDKAADLKSQVDESDLPDPTPLAPDVEPPTAR